MSVDLILRGGTIVDVVEKRCYAGDVRIKNGLIHSIERTPTTAGAVETLDITRQYVIPGFIDPHLHIESSMLSPLEFAQAAVRRGTTAVFVGSARDRQRGRQRGYCSLPAPRRNSSPRHIHRRPLVRAGYRFRGHGGGTHLAEIEVLLPHPRVYGLAEMMNFPGIIYDVGEARAKVESAYNLGKVVDGHAPGVSGNDLILYITNGQDDGTVRIMSDHESRTGPEALEKRRAGMTVAIRYGSATKDLDQILPFLAEQRVSLDGFMLCSDDLDADELHNHGHVDRIVRRARDILVKHAGLDAEQAAIQAIAMATLHPARYFSRFFRHHGHAEMGEIAPGKIANLAILESLETLKCSTVLRRGEVVVAKGDIKRRSTAGDYGGLLDSVAVKQPLKASDFAVPYGGPENEAATRVIGAKDGSLTTENKVLLLPVHDGEIGTDPSQDTAKIAVIERHHHTGTHAVGFVSGLGLLHGAVASTVGHDSHNLMVAGVDEQAMAAAANHLIAIGGGMAVAIADQVTALPLAIGGLMSTEKIYSVVRQYQALLAAAKLTGTTSRNIFLLLSFLALPVIPQLKITNRGLVDVDAFAPVPLMAEQASR